MSAGGELQHEDEINPLRALIYSDEILYLYGNSFLNGTSCRRADAVTIFLS
jgi:hypothetical protein